MQFAKLKWINQHPYSLTFDDIYYASDDGLAETEHVFIQYNQLSQRFLALSETGFTITETGFGTGLNFYCAAQHFLDHTPTNTTLHFISIEQHPLMIEDLIRANHNWPTLMPIANQLHTAYAQLKTGCNTINICQGRIQLSLWIGDVSECLPKIQNTTDAWFLDGFAPSKNSDMWTEKLFAEISRLSKPNTTFATFTSAGVVRRGLQAAGFKVDKVAGFGKKREMLSGYFLEQPF